MGKTRKILASYSKEAIEEIINRCNSIKDFITIMGLSANGNTYNEIKKLFVHYDINYDSLAEKGRLYGITLKRGRRKPLDMGDIMVENSSYNRQSLKNRIIKNNLIPYECSICGNSGEWLGKKLVLRLDHINGINNDNRLKNLRFVCPNCDSQLNTFCGKNVKKVKRAKNIKKYYCTQCGKEISRSSKGLCINCYKKEKQKNKPPKEVLLEDILKLPFVKIGKKYGVTDNAVRKWCKSYGIPHRRKDLRS